MNYSNHKISDWMLERYLLGELPPDKIESIDKAVTEDKALSLRIEALKTDNETILAHFPAEKVVKRIADAMDDKKSRRAENKSVLLKWAPIAVPAFTCALVFVMFQNQQRQEFTPLVTGPEITRVKGLAPKILVYKKSVGKVEALRDGAFAKEGDTLQISYLAATMKYGMIFSVDGRGSVTLHFPSELQSQAMLNSKGETNLPFSYQLDDAPAFENFIFVTSSEPMAVKEMLSKIKNSKKSSIGELTSLFPAPQYKTSFVKIKKG